MTKREELNLKMVTIEDQLSLNASKRTRLAQELVDLGRDRRRLEMDRADLASELRELTRE